MPQILNIRDIGGFNRINPRTMLYVGRTRQRPYAHFGNPFTHKKNVPHTTRLSSRNEACDAFASWLIDNTYPNIDPERRAWIRNQIALGTHRGKDLVCFCAPKRCHATTLLELINA